MAVNIDGYLDVISGEKKGDPVRYATANAAEALRNGIYIGADIDFYLNIIRSGVYGRDIRFAIYEALRLLNATPAEGGSGFIDNATYMPNYVIFDYNMVGNVSI